MDNIKTNVVMKEFEINATPLEKILLDAYSVEIFLDDVLENRYKISVSPYQAIRIVTIDCTSSKDYYNDYSFRGGRYHRHILTMERSCFLNELREKTSQPEFLEKSKHFILPLQENIIELIAYDLNLEKISN